LSAVAPITDMQRLLRHVGFVLKRTYALQRNRRGSIVKWSCGSSLACARQNDPELSEKPGFRLNIDATAMLPYDDVVAHRQAKPGAFARGLGREERVEYFFFDLFGDPGPIVANTDFDPVPEVSSRRPAPGAARAYADAGGVLAYGPNVPDNFRRAAGYIDKILKGVKLGDLPIEQPIKFDFILNLKASRALGLEVPRTLLARADEVIE
jgi:hypothetical protein